MAKRANIGARRDQPAGKSAIYTANIPSTAGARFFCVSFVGGEFTFQYCSVMHTSYGPVVGPRERDRGCGGLPSFLPSGSDPPKA